MNSWLDDEETVEANRQYKEYVVDHFYDPAFDIFEEIEYCEEGIRSFAFQHDYLKVEDYRDRLSFLKWQLLFMVISNN